MEALCWGARVAGLLFRERFLSHRPPRGGGGARAGRGVIAGARRSSSGPNQNLLLGFKSFSEVQ